MSLDERSKNILDELISNPSITSTTLENKYSISRRQLGYSFNKINDWLTSMNLPVIERTRKGCFIIDQSVFTNLHKEEDQAFVEMAVLTENERVYLILMMLVSSKEELSLNHFTAELEVSKNTVLNDLKQAQSYLNEYDLTIRYSRKAGYVLEGKEFQIRKLLINVTYQLLHMNVTEHKLMEVSSIKTDEREEFSQRIFNLENKLNIKITDEKMATMPYILILILRRIQQGHELQLFSIKYEELSHTKEYQATEAIFQDQTEIPVQERLFFTLHLLTTNVYWSEYLTEDHTTQQLIPVINNMLRLFEKSACVYLQDREQLVSKLLQHIKPAFYRIKYQLTETIDIQGAMNKELKELQHLVKRSISPLKDFIGKAIPESEISFITMLVGGWMRRQGESLEKKTKAIVVCPQGVSVSRLMFSELSELFPGFVFLDSLSVREFLNYELEYDLVFSPTYLETDKKLFISKPFLSEEEKYRLRKQVMLEIHGYIPNHLNAQHLIDIVKNHAEIKNEKALTEALQSYIERDEESSVSKPVKSKDINLDQLIPHGNIKLRDSVSSWEEAVRLSSRPLLEQGKIEREYVESMIQRSNEDPYIVIGSGIAIPHAAPDEGVNEVSMSMLRLKRGVNFTADYHINLVIVIAAVDKQQHIHALMQLMKLAGSEKDKQRMINAATVEEIYEILKLYSNEKELENTQ